MADLMKTESTSYDSLISGLNRSEMKTFPVTVLEGQNLKRGALVKFAAGKVQAVTEKTDTVFGIIAEDVDATKGELPGVVYVNGDFNADAIVLAEGLTASDFVLAARNVGIFLR